MAEDLDTPTSPDDYRSGFFGANYVSDPAGAFTNWLDPGDKWFRVTRGENADGTPATQVEIDAALLQWNTIFDQCERWRIRLHHVAELRWEHATNPKLWVYYSTNIPAAKKQQIKNCLVAGSFQFIGDTFAEAKASLEDEQVGLSLDFFQGRAPNIAPGDPDKVVVGWEADFGL